MLMGEFWGILDSIEKLYDCLMVCLVDIAWRGVTRSGMW